MTGDGSSASSVAVFRAKDLSFVTAQNVSQGVGKVGWLAIRHGDHRLFTSASELSSGEPGHSFRIDFAAIERKSAFLLDQATFRVYGRRGSDLTLEHMQGGTFTPSGDLYTSNGLAQCVYGDPVPESPVRRFRLVKEGVFHEVAKSNRRDDPFHYEIDPGDEEEPEGLTWWDLDTVPHHPKVSGQLHAVMLDNDCLNEDDVYVKHYEVAYD